VGFFALLKIFTNYGVAGTVMTLKFDCRRNLKEREYQLGYGYVRAVSDSESGSILPANGKGPNAIETETT
jgi:hypothetical protein